MAPFGPSSLQGIVHTLRSVPSNSQTHRSTTQPYRAKTMSVKGQGPLRWLSRVRWLSRKCFGNSLSPIPSQLCPCLSLYQFIFPFLRPKTQCLLVQVPPIGNSGFDTARFGLSSFFAAFWYSTCPYFLTLFSEEATPCSGSAATKMVHNSIKCNSPSDSEGRSGHSQEASPPSLEMFGPVSTPQFQVFRRFFIGIPPYNPN